MTQIFCDTCGKKALASTVIKTDYGHYDICPDCRDKLLDILKNHLWRVGEN